MKQIFSRSRHVSIIAGSLWGENHLNNLLNALIEERNRNNCMGVGQIYVILLRFTLAIYAGLFDMRASAYQYSLTEKLFKEGSDNPIRLDLFHNLKRFPKAEESGRIPKLP